jgi:acetyl-CoA acetyltransferase
MYARRYLHDHNRTSLDFAQVAMLERRNAATNPDAYFYERPITIDEHQDSRWVVEPLRLLDCCLETEGAVALIVTTADRARDLRQAPAFVRAAAQGCGRDHHVWASFSRADLSTLPELEIVADQLWRRSGLSRHDIDCAVLYDHFSPFVLMQLEALGICRRGQAGEFIAAGGADVGGLLPVNPHGGQLGEAYLQGYNGIAEAVRQIRGTAANQVGEVANVLVTGGQGIPTSGLVLSAVP